MPQEYSLNKSISSLWLTCTHLKNFKSLVIIQKNSLRTTYNFAVAILTYNINCISSPYINRHDTIILIIKSNSAGLSIGSAARNIRLSFKISKSRCSRIRSRISSQTIEYISSCYNALFNCLFVKASIVFKSFIITWIPKGTLTICQLTLNNYFSTRIGQIHSRPLNCINFTSKTVHDISAFAFWNSNSMMH